ncbi:MAG: tetratricopeptide repeat protein [Aestuariivirga sp.]|uniref:tetratricopeptide repeat protein n=1 Tax=Aestuariivirga sp. TaxID=2650926 RepID=UPI0038D0B1FE
MSRARRHTALFLALAAATLLAGCSKTTPQLSGDGSLTTASTAPMSLEGLAGLNAEWRANPKDINKGLAYANGLEAAGKTQEQLDVYRRLVELNPENARLSGLYGRKLVAAGHPASAVAILEAAQQRGETDWRVASALGSAYDQQGLYQKARAQYQTVLSKDPQNVTALNNLAMSYALEGDLKQAEAELRKADALPAASKDPRIRQNLALVVGLQGRFDEATALARQDLPPEQVEENMAYLRKMLSQPNTWQQISQNDQG